MPAFGLIEWRDAHQPVHTDFALQQAEGVFAIHREGRGLQPGFFTRLVIVKHGLESLPLGPAQIHAQQHVGPVLRLGAARAGMDGHDGVARVVLARKQRLGFELVNDLAQCIDFVL